jgi:predicted permease
MSHLTNKSDRKRHLSDLESDIQNHIEIETQDNIARGMSAEEARYAAARKFGNVTRVVEDTREVWAIAWLDHLMQDLRFAFRGIRKSPLFATIVVLTLALGIGANTAIFTIIDSVMLRSIPVSDPQHLVVFSWKAHKDPDLSGHSSFGDCDDRPGQSVRMDCSLSVPFSQSLRARASEAFSELAAFCGPLPVNLSGNGQAALTRGTYVSGDFFSTLGVPMFLGRTLGATDDDPAAPAVIVLDYSYWRRAFASDRNVIARSVRLNNTSATIVGVTDPHFTNLTPGKVQDFYMPMSLVVRIRSEWWATGERLYQPDSFWVVILGRLRPGVSMGQAQAAATTVFRNDLIHGAKPLFQDADEPTIQLTPAPQALRGESSEIAPMLYLLMVAVGIVLLIACANVAGLMLARSARRQKEMALRIAIGASPGRIVRQLLTESVLLSVLGGALGVLLAVWGVRAITHFIADAAFDSSFPYIIDLNWHVLAFTVATTFVTGILFGLAPARRCGRVEVNPALKESPSSASKRSTARWLRLGDVLVVAQVALSIVVAVGAGLLVRSLQNLRALDTGFQTENLLVFGINPPLAGYTDAQSPQLYRSLQERLSAIPGVTSVSYSGAALISGNQSGTDIHLDGAPSGTNPEVDVMTIGLEYFSTMKIPLLTGRIFTALDFVSAAKTEAALSAARKSVDEARKAGAKLPIVYSELTNSAATPVLINRAFAQKYFANQNPIGKHFGPSDHHPEVSDQPGYSVIGVVGDAKYSGLRREIKPAMYQPLLADSAHFALRTAVDPTTIVPAAREAVYAADRNLPIFELSTQSDLIDRMLFEERLMTRASSFFGVLTIALACFGLYGLLSYEVAWRTRELGIRMALGAQSRDILRLVIKQVIAIVAIGLAAGVAAALGLTRFMSEMLYNVHPNDPATIVGVALLLAIVALIACYLPARRAIHTDPIIALRHE